MTEEIICPKDIVTTYVITTNTMEPRDGGYFAYEGSPNSDRLRGYGYTPREAVECLIDLKEGKDTPMTKISCCPFCGSPDVDCMDDVTQWVYCLTCGASGSEADTRAEAIIKWNELSRIKFPEWELPERESK